jgi:SM-20-related protein
VGARLALFLADAFIHEVLPATQPRWSLTGWFRRKAAL